MAIDDFSRDDAAVASDDVTRDCFVEAMLGELEAVGFRTEAGFDGLSVRGLLWGGNLAMLQSCWGQNTGLTLSASRAVSCSSKM